MRGSKFTVITISSLFVFVFLLLLPIQGYATSGVRINEDISMTGANPAPDQTQTHTLSFKIRNTNDVCNEDVKITKPALGFTNDPFAERDGLVQKGSAKFLGFSETPGGPLHTELNFELVDETTKTIYFDVETGEDSNGCDFHAFKAMVRVCDTGPKCFFCCDWFDPPCEPPTPHKPEITVNAASAPIPSGTGGIFGKVADSTGGGLHARITIHKMGACVPGKVDNDQTYTMTDSTRRFGPQRGTYETTSLPFGNYEVVARMDGERKTKTVVVNSATPVEVNFVF